MTETLAKPAPQPTPEQRRIAAEQFERANQVVTGGDFEYGINLLLVCLKLEPGNILYRQTLRRTQKAKFGNNMKGSSMAFMSTAGARSKMKRASMSGDHLAVLEHGEAILSKSPWDQGTQMEMAKAADAAGLTDVGIFILDQARQKYPKDPTLNRALARLFEKRGHFQHAIALWQLVKEADPKDMEASHKAKDLAASETIARGNYASGGSNPVITLGGTGTGGGTSKEMPALDRVTRETAPILAKIQQNPTDPHLYQQVGAIYKKLNRADKAREILEKGLAACGTNFAIRSELMEMEIEPLLKNLQLTEARIKEMEAAGDDEVPDEDAPSIEDLQRIRKRLTKEINNREVEIFRMKADRFPTDAVPRLELAVRLYEGSKVDEAIAELQQVRKDARLGWKALMYLGLCFLAKNNWRLAQRNLEEALAAAPPNDETARKRIMYHLAKGNAESGDLTKAIEIGHDLQNIDYVYKDISQLLAKWEAKLQQA